MARRVTLSQFPAISEKRNVCFNPTTSPQHEGRFGQSSRHVGRDAMDAAAREMMRAGAYGQVVWFWLPDAGVKFAEYFRIRWWLKSPAHQEERGVSRKAIAQGVPDVFGLT